jgi:hypothetical protein
VMARNEDYDPFCTAIVDEDRGRVWDSGAELYFRVPDWSEGTVVHADLGQGITDVQTCWNVLGAAMLDDNGVLTFELAPIGHDEMNPMVGCLVHGVLSEAVRNIPVTYSGTHCFASPPPPPAVFGPCSSLFRFVIASPWGVGDGWTVRVLMHANECEPLGLMFEQSQSLLPSAHSPAPSSNKALPPRLRVCSRDPGSTNTD